MADRNFEDFEARIERIGHARRKMTTGYTRFEERDGILVPVGKVRGRNGFPWRGLFLVLMAFMLFKAVVLAYLGPVTYLNQHAKLEEGMIVEQMAAWALRPDIVTVMVAGQIAPVLHLVENLLNIGS